MDPVDAEIQQFVAAKEERRRRRIALPFEEKVRIVVQMQRTLAPVLQAQGIPVRVWDVRGPDASADTPSGGC